jgi:hypothetical protein
MPSVREKDSHGLKNVNDVLRKMKKTHPTLLNSIYLGKISYQLMTQQISNKLTEILRGHIFIAN